MGFTIDVGKAGPSFNLKGVDGNHHSLDDCADKKAVAVVFTCNHCPTAVQYEDRLIQLQKDYADRGVLLVAINPNEDEGHPTDSYENMIRRAEEKGFNFPYLRDATQEVARAYGAVRTPHVFLLDQDRKVAYHGRIDDNADDPKAVGRHDLREALDEILAGKPVSVPSTVPVGCSVKWWGKDAHWMPED
ncbi:MAG: thioredoxin family protein [Candidatus Brocadiae bacterium]|nr:thioredoxin family protein [Candidatus Brocadiia bacterium]